MPAVVHPKLVRLETLVDGSWVRGLDVALLYPERYAERLAAKGKVGRAIELDDRLQPTGQVWGGGAVGNCSVCEEIHEGPYDGRCLL